MEFVKPIIHFAPAAGEEFMTASVHWPRTLPVLVRPFSSMPLVEDRPQSSLTIRFWSDGAIGE